MTALLLPLSASLALLPGCKDKAGTPDTGDTSGDGGGYISHETGVWTGDDTGTGDGGGGATDGGGGGGTTDGGGTGDGGTEVLPVVTSLALYPTSMVVWPGATWDSRVIATWDDGTVGDADVVWTSLDEAVATVDAAGVVTAVAAGSTVIQASRDGVTVETSVEVRDDGLVTVTVLDQETGAPHVGARVRLGAAGPEGTTDKKGRISLAWKEKTPPATVSAWARERVPTTVIAPVQRELVVPMRAEAGIEPVLGSIGGSVDMDGIPSGGGGDLKMGLAAPSLVQGPLLIDPALLIGAPREVTLYGVTADVPANLFIRDAAEDYEVPAVEGTTGVWSLAAPLAIGDVTSGLAGATDAIGLMLEDLDKVVWGFEHGATLLAGESATVDIAPGTALTGSLTVDVGELSVGFSGDEEMLVLLGEQLPEQGFTPVGLGVGRFEVELAVVPGSLPGSEGRTVAAIAQVGGLGAGTGYGVCTSWAPALDEGDEPQALPALQQVPALHLFDPATRAFTLETDPRARWVHVRVQGGEDGAWHDLVMDGGRVESVLPHLGGAFGYGGTAWTLVALELEAGSFHDLVREGWPTDQDLARVSQTSGLLTQEP